MLEHGTPAASSFLPQLEVAKVTSWRCECGCASIRLTITGRPIANNGVYLLADFVMADNEQAGIFIYQLHGVLSGIEMYSTAGSLKALPTPEKLRSGAVGRC
jgi:hypothetical protein